MTMRMILAAGLLSACAGAAAAQCVPSSGGTVYKLSPVGSGGTVALPRVDIAAGYHVNVSVNGGPDSPVLIDTGSNLLVLPYFKFGNLPADAAQIPGTPGVLSGLVPYSYGSSGNGYRGYLVQSSVVVNRRPANAASPNPPSAPSVVAYAVTESCSGTGVQTVCTPVVSGGHGSGIGMMGVGFQKMPATLVMTDGSTPTATNVFGQVAGLQTVGYAFAPDAVVVGLNAEVTRGVQWTAMDNDTLTGAGVPIGCFTVTPPGGGQSVPYCGTMLLDTGLADMYAWQNASPSICPSRGSGAKTAGFSGVPFQPGTKVGLTSPPSAPVMNYSFTVPQANQPGQPGTPRTTYCAPTQMAPHTNISRMPLALYTYYRNQSCGTFGFTPN